MIKGGWQLMWYMTDERKVLQKTFREFAEKEIRPFVPQMEQEEKYPRQILRKMGKLNYLGLATERKYGGDGKDYIHLGLLLEEVSKVSHTMGLLTFVASQLTVGVIKDVCTPEQIEKWVKPALRGDLLMSMANDEAAGSGNISEFETTAKLVDDKWVVNGSKIFITNADMADLHVVTCITDKVNPKTLNGASLIAVPADADGVEVGHMENKLGWHGSHTGQLYFNNVHVPKENLIGPLNQGYNLEGGNLLNEITAYGPMDLGAAESVWQETKHYLQHRMQGKLSIWDAHESARDEMSDLWCQINNFRNTVYSVLNDRNNGENVVQQAIGIKIQGEQLLEHVVSECIELHGGIGTIYETGLERFYRDAKMASVGCGSDKVLLSMLSQMI